MRPKIAKVITQVSLAIYGICSCGGNIVYLSDNGIKCQNCNKLYGTWHKRKPKILVEPKD